MTSVVVKGTFLQVEGGDDEDDQPSASRTVTAPGALMGKSHTGSRGGEAEYVDDGSGGWRRTNGLETMEEEDDDEDDDRKPQRAVQGFHGGYHQGEGHMMGDDRGRSPNLGKGSKRSPKSAGKGGNKRSPRSAGGVASDPWGFGQAAPYTGLPPGPPPAAVAAAASVPPVPMPMMAGAPGIFPPWPHSPNPFMAAAMNVAAMQMMAGVTGMPGGGMPSGTMPTAMPGGMAGFGGMPPGAMTGGGFPTAQMSAPQSPQRRGKKGQQQQHQQMAPPPAPVQFETGEAQGRTTVMLRNIPNNYTRAMLLELLDSQGLIGRYDFVYLPFDFKTEAGLGFAFVNLLTPEDAELCKVHLTGFRSWAIPSGKICEVGWSGADQQGLDANIERYRNSSVMHQSVPDELKPVKFMNGVQVPFPKPTRKVWPPHSNYGLRARRAQAQAHGLAS